MATKKSSPKQKPAEQISGPQASRPFMPGYGIPKDKKGLLPWSHVAEQMDAAKHYWVCTVDSDGHPHATPVDGLWVDDRLYFGGSPKTRRHRNLAANPAVCVHLENAMNVIILQGEAQELRAPDALLVSRLIDASKKKYGYAPQPKDFEAGGVFAFRPRKVLAWTQFPKDATRWQFEGDE